MAEDLMDEVRCSREEYILLITYVDSRAEDFMGNTLKEIAGSNQPLDGFQAPTCFSVHVLGEQVELWDLIFSQHTFLQLFL